VKLDQIQRLHPEVLARSVHEPPEVRLVILVGDVGVEPATGLRGDRHLLGVDVVFEHVAEDALRAPVAVHICGVEEIDSGVAGGLDRCDRLGLGHVAPVAPDLPRAVADLADLADVPERSVVHVHVLLIGVNARAFRRRNRERRATEPSTGALIHFESRSTNGPMASVRFARVSTRST